MNNIITGECDSLIIASAAGLACAALPALGLCTVNSTTYMIAIAIFRFCTAHAAGAYIGPEFNTLITSIFALGSFALLTQFIHTTLIIGLLIGFLSTNSLIFPQAGYDETDSLSPFKAEKAPATGFADLVQVPEVTNKLQQIVTVMLDVQNNKNPYCLEPLPGILLHGPPGTGKTALTRALAHELKASIFVVPSGRILESLLGGTEKRIDELFNAAIAQCKKKPTKPVIIFMDEIDALGTRDDRGNVVGKTTIPSLIQRLNGYHELPEGILFIGATNRLEDIDLALKDRLRCIETKRPNQVQREQLFAKYIGSVQTEGSLSCNELAQQTDGFSYRQIRRLIAEAKAIAHLDTDRTPKQLLKQDFSTALQLAS